MIERNHTNAVEKALAGLDLDTKARLLAGQDMWTLPAIPQIGLRSLVMSDGPIGVRGVDWSAEDPSVALPSPTALAATWDPDLATATGELLAQEARRKGVHVLLAPTVNLHRSPLGGRHFECYSEDPWLTGEIGAGYVRGVQQGGVGTTVKHFVGNDAETDRFTVSNRIGQRPLRELYLAPFERIVAQARPWGIMTAYNQVNGVTMTEHRDLVQGVLRGEWGFDGYNVSDWTAARTTTAALLGGLDVAMPGPHTVFGPALAQAVRDGHVPETAVDDAVRRVLLLAARTGCLDGVQPAVDPADLPRDLDGRTVARDIARRSSVLLRNQPSRPDRDGQRPLLPLDATRLERVAVIGASAQHARVLGGGSATVFPEQVISPLQGLRAALPEHVTVDYALGADPRTNIPAAADGFTLQARYFDAAGALLAEHPLFDGKVLHIGRLPDGVTAANLHAVEITGHMTPQATGTHTFSAAGTGHHQLTLDGVPLLDEHITPANSDPFEAFLKPTETRTTAELTSGQAVPVTLRYVPSGIGGDDNMPCLTATLGHAGPQLHPDAEIEQAVNTALNSDVAIVVVGTTEEVESEGFDRDTLQLPGRQNELVTRVAAVNPNTVVVINAGSPVELPWRDEVPAILLTWFPGQEAGAALADVLLGHHEPGGRLPTTWPAHLTDAPVTRVTPENGVLTYAEGVHVGYRAWQRSGIAPAYCFGHGLGYTTWDYENATCTPPAGDDLGAITVRVRNTGQRPGREVIQVYLAPHDDSANRPTRWLVGFASVEAAPNEAVESRIRIPRRAAQVWDETAQEWRTIIGTYTAEIGHSLNDLHLHTAVNVTE